jgi:dephospho-CoA kinase
VDRDVLRDLGHELRLKYGAGVLSQRVLDHIAFDLRQGVQYTVVIADAIRNPAEVRLLRDSLGDDFILVAIEAPEAVIISRLRDRARSGDVLDDDDLARRVLAAEMGLNEPDHGHNIAECIALADVRINNSGPLPELRAEVGKFVGGQLPVES